MMKILQTLSISLILLTSITHADTAYFVVNRTGNAVEPVKNQGTVVYMNSDNRWDLTPPYGAVVYTDSTSHVYISCLNAKVNPTKSKIICNNPDNAANIRWTPFTIDPSKKDPWENAYYRSDVRFVDFDNYTSIHVYVVCDKLIAK